MNDCKKKILNCDLKEEANFVSCCRKWAGIKCVSTLFVIASKVDQF
jgi:hypothetical protein